MVTLLKTLNNLKINLKLKKKYVFIPYNYETINLLNTLVNLNLITFTKKKLKNKNFFFIKFNQLLLQKNATINILYNITNIRNISAKKFSIISKSSSTIYFLKTNCGIITQKNLEKNSLFGGVLIASLTF